MPSSYETTELITSHHAELERLCEEVLELGTRVEEDERDRRVLNERIRALSWRVRAHRAEETAAFLSLAGDQRQRVAQLVSDEATLDSVAKIEEAADLAGGPIEAARAACQAARSCREQLDHLAKMTAQHA